MKEEKTKSKKRLLYYLVLAVCVLLLVAATVLTVYFVTAEPNNVLDVPVVDDPGPVGPGTDIPDDPGPSEPSGGQTARFIRPVESDAYSVEYASIYENKVVGWIYRHKAIDFAADEGATVRAMCDGRVEEISTREETGKFIVIDHGDVKSVYRFIEIPASIKVGDTVKQGDVIGTVAAAYGIEHKDGTHLHLEMKKGKDAVNPLDYIDVVLNEK